MTANQQTPAPAVSYKQLRYIICSQHHLSRPSFTICISIWLLTMGLDENSLFLTLAKKRRNRWIDNVKEDVRQKDNNCLSFVHLHSRCQFTVFFVVLGFLSFQLLHVKPGSGVCRYSFFRRGQATVVFVCVYTLPYAISIISHPVSTISKTLQEKSNRFSFPRM